ncbi:MAG: hypothetical protein R3E48_19795 [Burkholderiaceae bacterium]
MSGYDYASGDLLESPHTYFFSPFDGASFLRAWQQSRLEAATELASGLDDDGACVLPAARVGEPPTLVYLRATLALLEGEGLDADGWRHFDRLLRNFEAKRRLYDDYAAGFVSRGRLDHLDLRVYAAFGAVVAAAARQRSTLRYTNALLKVADILCACRTRVAIEWTPVVGAVLARERAIVTAIAARLGVVW